MLVFFEGLEVRGKGLKSRNAERRMSDFPYRGCGNAEDCQKNPHPLVEYEPRDEIWNGDVMLHDRQYLISRTGFRNWYLPSP